MCKFFLALSGFYPGLQGVCKTGSPSFFVWKWFLPKLQGVCKTGSPSFFVWKWFLPRVIQNNTKNSEFCFPLSLERSQKIVCHNFGMYWKCVFTKVQERRGAWRYLPDLSGLKPFLETCIISVSSFLFIPLANNFFEIVYTTIFYTYWLRDNFWTPFERKGKSNWPI